MTASLLVKRRKLIFHRNGNKGKTVSDIFCFTLERMTFIFLGRGGGVERFTQIDHLIYEIKFSPDQFLSTPKINKKKKLPEAPGKYK